MLSDVTLSYGTQSISVPGLYLLIGILIILGLIGFIVAIASARRIERKTNEATDILVVQLERIGDALDRLVTQNPAAATASNPAHPPAQPTRAANRSLSEWVVPGRSAPPAARIAAEASSLERAAQKRPAASSDQTPQTASPAQSSTEMPPERTAGMVEKPVDNQSVKLDDDQPVESTLSEPARTILFSMLNQ